MTNVIADISMSLDGFVTGPNPDLEHGLGRGGEPLHTWAVESSDQVDAQVLREAVAEGAQTGRLRGADPTRSAAYFLEFP